MKIIIPEESDINKIMSSVKSKSFNVDEIKNKKDNNTKEDSEELDENIIEI